MVKTLLPDAISGPDTLEGVARGNVNFKVLDVPGQQREFVLDPLWCAWNMKERRRKASLSASPTRGDSKVYRLKARAVVMAGGSWTTKHIVIDLPSTNAKLMRSFCVRRAC